jgi:hypothetical protein
MQSSFARGAPGVSPAGRSVDGGGGKVTTPLAPLRRGFVVGRDINQVHKPVSPHNRPHFILVSNLRSSKGVSVPQVRPLLCLTHGAAGAAQRRGGGSELKGRAWRVHVCPRAKFY